MSNGAGFEIIGVDGSGDGRPMQANQSSNTYWQARREHNRVYYGHATALAKKYAAGAASLIDVGNRGCEYVYEWDWIHDKTVLDLSDEIFRLDDTVQKIQQDFLAWRPERQYDLVTCLQTLEHFEDPLPFIDKLHRIQKDILLVSLPFMWPADKAPLEHKHDPIDLPTIHAWLGSEPLEQVIATERNGTQRWVGVYASRGAGGR